MSRAAAGAPGVNLMPLLDVLLCTMGTLIVILGVINREARLHPSKRLHGKAAQEQQQMIEAHEDLELRIEQLKGSKEKTLADLNTNRTRLAGIEDSKRKLEDQLQSLIDAAKKLPNANSSNDEQMIALRSELSQLNAQRGQLENDLRIARATPGNGQAGYAVVPCDSLYKTNRRPIYIECRANAIILQPEGIEFIKEDFMGPNGPSAPLAAALRTAEEYWRQAPRPAPDLPNDPYLLILVRPDGMVAFELVQMALFNWHYEYGWDFVKEDWNLEFPVEEQTKLKEMEMRAVAEARQQLKWLAQVSPELFSRKANKVEYHVAPGGGGIVRDDGSPSNEPDADDPLRGFGRSRKPGNSGMPGMNGTGGGGSGSFAGGSADGRGNSAFGTDPNPSSGNGQSGVGNGQGGFSNSQGGRSGNGGLAGGNGSMPGSNGGMTGNTDMIGGASGMAGGNTGMDGNPDLGSASGSFNGSNGFNSSAMGGANPGANTGRGGSGTGSVGSPGTAGAEVDNVGPRYAGTGNGTVGFGNGSGNFAGTQGGTGNSPENLGGGNGNSNSGATNDGNGNSSTPGDKANSNGGANSFAGGPISRNGIPGGAMGSPSEYGGVLLPSSTGDMTNSSAGSSSRGGGGSDGSQSGQYAGSSGGSYSSGSTGSSSGSSGSYSSGGSGASSGSTFGSGSPGGVTALGSPGGDPNLTSGVPSIPFGMSSQQVGAAMPDDSKQPPPTSSSASSSMARNRGKNWAVSKSQSASMAVNRPIRVECWPDRLVLVPDTNDQQPQVVPLGQRTEDALDPLVGAVRTYTKSWGMAGRGMYWKPQLVLNVNPNADRRASDLQALLADSGWDVKKR